MTALIIVVGVVGVVATLKIFWELGGQSIALETRDPELMEESSHNTDIAGAVLLVAGVVLALLALAALGGA